MTQISIPGLILNFEQSINQWFPHPPMQNHCLSLFPQNQLLMTYLPNSILAVMPSSLGTFHLSLGSPLPHPLHMPASKSYSHPHPNLLKKLTEIGRENPWPRPRFSRVYFVQTDVLSGGSRSGKSGCGAGCGFQMVRRACAKRKAARSAL